MTSDLERFSNRAQLDRWSRERNRRMLALMDRAGSLQGVIWVTEKTIPERGDYVDPELMRGRAPSLTWAIRLYGSARGQGVAIAFSEHALARLAPSKGAPPSLWFQTRACNAAARTLGRNLGFLEVSGEEGGTVVGIRFSGHTASAAGSD